MSVDILVPIYLIALFTALTGISVATLFGGKRYFRLMYRRTLAVRKTLNGCLAGGPLPSLPRRGFHFFLREYSRLRDEAVIPDELASLVSAEIERRRLRRKWLRSLRSAIKARRMEAAAFLALCPDKECVSILLDAFERERSSIVKFQIAHSLARMNASEAIDRLSAALGSGPDWYRYRLIEILLSFGVSLGEYIERELEKGNRTAMPLAIAFSRRFMRAKLRNHLVEEALGEGPHCLEATRVLADRFPKSLDRSEFLEHRNAAVRGRAWAALAQFPTRENLDRLVEAASDASISDAVGTAISEIIRRTPAFLPILLNRFEKEISSGQTSSLSRVGTLSSILAARMDYFVYGGRNIDQLMDFIIKGKRVAALGSFLRSNRNEEIEANIIGKIRTMMRDEDKEALSKALDKRFLDLLELPAPAPIPRRNALKIGRGSKVFLWCIAIAAILSPPILFVALSPAALSSPVDTLRRYIIAYTYNFAYYSIVVNGIYLLLLSLSVFQLIRQLRIWNQARTSFLVTERMMAPVSLIVPAFREEASIVENVRSLLSLNYPLFEVIVVCDGSPDATLERVVEAYAMEKSDEHVRVTLPCAVIRGVYKCRAYPYLTVVDKANGGKADALNAGINFAKHDYLCCVDADSLLESDALTKIMYQVVADEKELVACGGNIIPVNDCEVKMGSIRRYAPPKSTMARFQTVEYLRAFLAGRLGWAFANSLLIISGAFGIFKRDRVMEIGGYLTGEGAGKFDTVGEDMELVVRLSRHMREKKLPFRIGYAFNANCWTEVPEDFDSLRKQRSRWHRGLLEILLYHRRCAFNPRYGTMGTVALPYFFIFEVIGPFFELFGWLTLPLAGLLGVLNLPVSLLLLAATVVFGISISTASLAISEFQVMYYSPKETMKLLAFSILENFGYRQVMSALRVFAYFSILAGTRGWGSMKRKGFAKANK